MRLENFLAKNTPFSKKDLCNLIVKELVKINGKIAKKGDRISKNLTQIIVEINNEVFRFNQEVYIMLNKPNEYVCANKDNLHKTIFELLSENINVKNLFSIGRLDIDTEGLILITNNGQLSHRLRSPKWKVNKKYYIELDNTLNIELIEIFSKGIRIDRDFLTLPSTLEIVSNNSCFLTISEGKFHQVKKMFSTLGFNVLYLKRVEFASLKLDDKLKLGNYRYLADDEIKLLKSACNLSN